MFSRIWRKTFKALCMFTNFQLDQLLNYKIEKNKFYQKKGYKLNLNNPQSFCEKIIWKKVNDRNPLIPYTADKYLVRSYIRNILGEKRAHNILVSLHYVTSDPSTIPFDDLPSSYIIKPNHMSGAFIIVNDDLPDRAEIINKCTRWLSLPYGLEKNEWAYKNMNKIVMIEELLLTKDNAIPDDYKMFMFHGKCRLIQHCLDRKNAEGLKINIYSPEWELQDVIYKERQRKPKPKPGNLDEMISIAEELSAPFDFVRVDFYSVDGQTYIGELTHYPGSGKNIIEPVEFDFELGRYWEIEKNYWSNNLDEIHLILQSAQKLQD
jgi:hypothetical protein